MPQIIPIDAILPGDVLLCRNELADEEMLEKTGYQYAHAAICTRPGCAAEADGSRVREVTLDKLLDTYDHLAVFRQPAGWSPQRLARLEEFIQAAISRNARFNTEGKRNFSEQRKIHEENLQEKLNDFFEGTHQAPNPTQQSYFCSELVAAAHVASGLIDPSAAVVYDPSVLAPGHLSQDFTFGIFCGYVVPYPGYTIPSNDELINSPTLFEIFFNE